MNSIENLVNDRDNQVVSRHGFTHRQFAESFAKAHDPDDWKGPISVCCPGETVLLLTEAIEYFTATHPRVSLDTKTMRYLIESEGYRAGPAGP
jgi:hypothetical protein